jgi:hypothetical protein
MEGTGVWSPPKKGPNGRNCCRWCGEEVKPPRRTFCSKEHVREWRLRSDPGYVRKVVGERDHGICAKCGLDTVALGQRARQERRDLKEAGQFRGAVVLDGREVPLSRTLWEADHIVPVLEGGGECGLENYRTLCLWCHKEATRKLHLRRRKQQVLPLEA